MDNSQLIAFGATNEIVICQMKPKIKELFSIKKPIFCKKKSIPYIDWGYGISPSQRDKNGTIIAFAWDKMI